MTSLWRHFWPTYDTLDFKILIQCVKFLRLLLQIEHEHVSCWILHRGIQFNSHLLYLTWCLIFFVIGLKRQMQRQRRTKQWSTIISHMTREKNEEHACILCCCRTAVPTHPGFDLPCKTDSLSHTRRLVERLPRSAPVDRLCGEHLGDRLRRGAVATTAVRCYGGIRWRGLPLPHCSRPASAGRRARGCQRSTADTSFQPPIHLSNTKARGKLKDKTV